MALSAQAAARSDGGARRVAPRGFRVETRGRGRTVDEQVVEHVGNPALRHAANGERSRGRGRRWRRQVGRVGDVVGERVALAAAHAQDARLRVPLVRLLLLEGVAFTLHECVDLLIADDGGGLVLFIRDVLRDKACTRAVKQ